MATNIPEIPALDSMLHFDWVATQIEQTFLELINQLIARKDALLMKLVRLREEYKNEEATRFEAIAELEKAQLQLQQINLKVNVNILVGEKTEQVYQQAKLELETPFSLPKHNFSTLSCLQSQIEQFGELVVIPNLTEKNQPILTAGKRGSGENELNGRQLALDEDTQKVYIADHYNSRIQVLSFQGEFLSRFGNEVISGPHGIAVTKSRIFVTDWNLHKLFHFCKHCHQLLNTAGGMGRGKGQLIKPYGLSVDGNGDMFIAEFGNDRVSVLSKFLKFKFWIGTGSLRTPLDVKLTPDKVLVLDRSPKCFHFFSRNGDHLSSCLSRGEGLECSVNQPHFFCLDTEQNIIIGNTWHHTVKIFTNSGELLHTIGREGSGKGEFKHPFGIAISNSGILFVLSDNPNYSLQCF